MLNHKQLVPLALLLTLFGCGGNPANMKAKEYKGHFEDSKQGLIFQCPTSWDIRENIEGHRVIARSPLEKAKGDKFQENLVVTGPVSATSLEEVHAQCEAEFKKLEHYQALPGLPDILDFDYQFKGQDLHARAYLIKLKDKNDYWVMQFTDAKADWPAHEAVFVQVMSTFGMAPGATPTPVVNIVPTETPGTSATPAGTATPEATATPVTTATPPSSPTPMGSATPLTTATPAAAASASPKPK